jgi:hypothetical protein
MLTSIAPLSIASLCGYWSYTDFRNGHPVIGTIGAVIALINVGGAVFL